MLVEGGVRAELIGIGLAGLAGFGGLRGRQALGQGLRVDGGASVMDLLLQLVADQARLEVVRPRSVETTAIGAATLAGLAEGVWGSLDELAGLWTADASFAPVVPADDADLAHRAWLRAVGRARQWTTGDEPTPG